MTTQQANREALQASADADEHDVEERYVRWHGLMDLIADAERRSEVMLRLERALEYRTVSI